MCWLLPNLNPFAGTGHSAVPVSPVLPLGQYLGQAADSFASLSSRYPRSCGRKSLLGGYLCRQAVKCHCLVPCRQLRAPLRSWGRTIPTCPDSRISEL